MADLVIGIDLGTTNSCVSLYIDGKVKILENSDGGRITSSFIFFSSAEETIVGAHAKSMASGRPDEGVYDVKRLVGRTSNDIYFQNNLKYLPFKVQFDRKGNPLVIVEQKTKILQKTPQELCTIILKKLKADTEAKLDHVIKKVVITVPAYFNVTQRKVTLDAATEAGFTVLKLLNEPTAAALSYYFENDSSENNYSLVCDLGGGTFDVAILKRSSDNIEIVAVDGDTQLGGHDFDNLIVNFVCEELFKEYDYDPRNNRSDRRRLQSICEDAKKALSTVKETEITLIGFVPNHICVQVKMTRQQFENIGQELFRRSIDIVEGCIRSSGVSKESIAEVILSGGSTRIPKIREMLSDCFGGKELNKFVNPDECVAEGAALQAAILSKSMNQVIQRFDLIDVVPLSLGVSELADKMEFLIRRNQRIPTSALETYATTYNQQESIKFNIYEGERLNAKKNRLIDSLTITNITPAPPGQCRIIFSMNLDENGILVVKAQEEYKNNVKELIVNYTRGSQSENEVRNTLLDAEQNSEEDRRFVKFAELKLYLLKYCIAVMYNMDKRNISDTYGSIYELCKESEASARDMDVEDEEQLKELTNEIKLQCEPHVKYYNFDLMPILED